MPEFWNRETCFWTQEDEEREREEEDQCFDY
jgi:hypothetical protein